MKEINTDLSKRMIGQTVTHKAFGEGTVTLCTNTAIRVKFADKERAFGFPYSFNEFLTVEDPELLSEIREFYSSGAWTEPIHDHCEE